MSRLIISLTLFWILANVHAQLPAPEYHKGKAVLSGTIENYNPNENLAFKIGAPNIVMGAAETLFPTIASDGTFKIDIPLYHSTQARIMIGVAFVYLAAPSSIEKTWKILIQDISGEHYWLDKQQWNYLWQHFQMSGLPMYLLIDKEGNIVKRFTHITAKELKVLLEQEINRI